MNLSLSSQTRNSAHHIVHGGEVTLVTSGASEGYNTFSRHLVDTFREGNLGDLLAVLVQEAQSLHIQRVIGAIDVGTSVILNDVRQDSLIITVNLVSVVSSLRGSHNSFRVISDSGRVARNLGNHLGGRLSWVTHSLSRTSGTRNLGAVPALENVSSLGGRILNLAGFA